MIDEDAFRRRATFHDRDARPRRCAIGLRYLATKNYNADWLLRQIADRLRRCAAHSAKMLHLGHYNARTCHGLTRRAFLSAGLSVPMAFGLPGLVRRAAAAEAPKARSVLLVWLWGGPSHLDLFDPKPEAPAEYRGPLATIATRSPGVRFTELVPRLAARSDRFTVVRSNQNFDGDHLIGGSIALTGARPTAGAYPPSFGSIVGRHRGYGGLPPFVSVGRGRLADGRAPMDGYGGGTWGPAFDPFMIRCRELGEVEVPALDLLDDLTPARLATRRELLDSVDRVRRRIESGPYRQWSDSHRQAYALLTSPSARGALDLTREPTALREAYGQSEFGQSLLLARRLIESDVPFVQVNWSQFVEIGPPPYDFGWDTHSHHFGLMADRHGPILDRALSALFDDLESRGLLETTLVVCMGEFGRTPRINHLASRDHWPACYFSLWAGAGTEPGRIVGASDRLAEHPTTQPITPPMVGTTILELAGVGTIERAELKVLEGAKVIDAFV